MAYFECIVGNGGGGQTDIPLIVNCDAQFAGLTITATQGLLSYTEICPSTSPYQVVFHLPQDGTWTISGTIDGTVYSESITISAFEMDLIAGFNWRIWVTAGGLDPTDYSGLSDIFADEAAVRRLMLVHASADYLIGQVTDDIDTLDNFVANDTAMKWLGLCDYVCDGITAITGAEAKLLASTYWERYLKDHVPTMTSNTAPYGTAGATSTYSGSGAWKSFDGLSTDYWSDNNGAVGSTQRIWYQFTNPIEVGKIKLTSRTPSYASSMKIVASNDGSTWVDIKAVTGVTANVEYELDVSDSANRGNYLYYGLEMVKANTSSIGLESLQFYGRALNVSVPIMTSNTVPYGEASASSVFSSSYGAYNGFNGANTTSGTDCWMTAANVTSGWLQYEFTSKVKVKMAILTTRNHSAGPKAPNHYAIKASNDGTTFKTLGNYTNTSNTANLQLVHDNFDYDNETDTYSIYRVDIADSLDTLTTKGVAVGELQFYGVDYSEKEFEAGSTRKWIYDNGLELESISAAITAGGTITMGDDYIEVNRTNGSANCSAATDSQIDLTPYNYAYAIVEDISGTFLYHICVISSRTAGVSAATASVNVSTAGPDVKGGLDISAVDQSQYVGIYAGNVTKFRIKEAWLTA